VIEPGQPAGGEGQTEAPRARTFRIELLPAGTTQSVEFAGERVEVAL
jgi:hypothetical protein